MWHPIENRLYWLDCTAAKLYQWDTSTEQAQSWEMPGVIGCIAPYESGGLVAFMGNGFWHVDTETGVAKSLVADVFPADKGYRCNDGKCDSKGRFWAGTVCTQWDKPGGQLCRLDF